MTLDDLMTDIQFIESDIKVEEPVKDEPVNTGKKKNNKDYKEDF